MTRPGASPGAPVKPASAADILSLIARTRKQAGLGQLATNPSLARLARSYGETLIWPPMVDAQKSLVVGHFYFWDYFRDDPAKPLMAKWLYDSTKRSILLSPGNYGAVDIVEDETGNKRVVVIIASILK
jgi:hypothetical protein